MTFGAEDTTTYKIQVKMIAGTTEAKGEYDMNLLNPIAKKDGAFKSVAMSLSALASLIVLSYFWRD